ncbi:DUF397 domain-containing protein [Streptomyces chattanoogensis]|uniref:DUF397 domain-containing protein n=1 Tax=Streptomyces chattanoogensis TaxID=66876 RepID=UPI00099D2E81|nr:DUF397 domain-containing protein [Streptomyces chattanoogensis]
MSPDRELTSAVWIKSSYSSSSGGECVEFSRSLAVSGLVPIRDSKNPYGPVLAISTGAWSSFVSAVKHEEFRA